MPGSDDWKSQAACKDISPEALDRYFFLGRGQSPKRTRELYCDGCPVKTECLEYGILYGEIGIWGGTTDGQRQRLARHLKPTLEREARQAGQLEERRTSPISLRQSYPDATVYPDDEDVLFDNYLRNTQPTNN